jgi:hypothetical protein
MDQQEESKLKGCKTHNTLIVWREVEVGPMGVKALAMCANSPTDPRVKVLLELTSVGKDVCMI